MSDLPDDIDAQLRRIREILRSEFEGNEAAMGRAISMPQASLNRALKPESAARISTASQRVRRLVDVLVEAGYRREWLETGEGPRHRDPSKVLAPATYGEGQRALRRGIAIYAVPNSLPNGTDLSQVEPVGHVCPVSVSSSLPLIESRDPQGFYLLIRGDAMEPTLSSGEIVPVRSFEPPKSDISEVGLYLVRYESRLFVRRLELVGDDRLRAITDNDKYGDRHFTRGDEVDWSILGRIISWG